MLGYMAAKQAKEYGFAHHGSYFGIPVWICHSSSMMVATKWAPMEYLISAMHYVEAFMCSVLYPNDEPAFRFMVGAKIDEK
jgi:hypothetical protein